MTSKSQQRVASASKEDAMTAWDMAVSIFVGVRQANAKAVEELTSRRLEADQHPFGKGVLSAVCLQRLLEDTERSLEADLRQYARSNGLALPE